MSARDEIERMLNEAFNFGGEFERAGSKEKVDRIMREYFALIDKAVAALCPPAPGEVRLTLSRKQAEAMRIELAEARSYFGEMLGDAQDGLSALESALAAAPGAAR